MYNWFMLLYSRDYPNIVNQLYSKKKIKNTKKIREKTQPLYHICGQQMDNGIAVLVLGWVLISETTK